MTTKKTKLCIKLHKFFKDNGITKTFMAEKLNLTNAHFYNVLAGRVPLTERYWIPLVKFTKGEITIADLEQEKLERLGFEVEHIAPGECKVIIKDLK